MIKDKIAIIIPCWKRFEVLSLVMKQLDLFCDTVKNRIDVIVIYVFSANDPELDKIMLHYLQANHPRDYLYSPNEMLGQKLNDGIAHAKQFKYDYIMNCGSDDLLHPDLMKLYEEAIHDNEMLFGINRVYFYEKGKDPLLFSSYNHPYLVGAGRMIHKTVINCAFHQYGGLYDPGIKRGMDTMSSKRMNEMGFTELTVNPGLFPCVVDIKSEVNINSFSKINQSYSGNKFVVPVDKKFLHQHFNLLKDYDK